MTDQIEALERLGRLCDEGKLTTAEYETLKREALDPSQPRGLAGHIEGLPSARSDNTSLKRTIGWILTAVGCASFFVVSWMPWMNGEESLDAAMLATLINPLVWFGAVGVFLLVSTRDLVSGTPGVRWRRLILGKNHKNP